MSTPKKVFVSYKYSDVVEGREDSFNFRDDLIERLGDNGLMHKGEDDESYNLSDYNDQQIIAKIAPYIKNSSISVVLITPNANKSEWIPWEISYSLRERAYKDESNMTRNGVIGVYLPLDYWNTADVDGDYDFYKTKKSCGVITHHTSKFPGMISDNSFNLINGSYECDKGCCEKVYTGGEGSYVELVEWGEFVDDIDKYLDRAWERRNKFDKYDTRINLKDGK